MSTQLENVAALLRQQLLRQRQLRRLCLPAHLEHAPSLARLHRLDAVHAARELLAVHLQYVRAPQMRDIAKLADRELHLLLVQKLGAHLGFVRDVVVDGVDPRDGLPRAVGAHGNEARFGKEERAKARGILVGAPADRRIKCGRNGVGFSGQRAADTARRPARARRMRQSRRWRTRQREERAFACKPQWCAGLIIYLNQSIMCRSRSTRRRLRRKSSRLEFAKETAPSPVARSKKRAVMKPRSSPSCPHTT